MEICTLQKVVIHKSGDPVKAQECRWHKATAWMMEIQESMWKPSNRNLCELKNPHHPGKEYDYRV